MLKGAWEPSPLSVVLYLMSGPNSQAYLLRPGVPLAGLAGQCLGCHSGCWGGPESELLQGTLLAFMGGVSSPSWAVLHQGQTSRVTTILFQRHHQTPSPVSLTQWEVPGRPSSGLYLSRTFQGESIVVLKWPSTYLLIWELAQSPSGHRCSACPQSCTEMSQLHTLQLLPFRPKINAALGFRSTCFFRNRSRCFLPIDAG